LPLFSADFAKYDYRSTAGHRTSIQASTNSGNTGQNTSPKQQVAVLNEPSTTESFTFSDTKRLTHNLHKSNCLLLPPSM